MIEGGREKDIREQTPRDRIVGFDYVIKPVKDGKYGSQLSNGSWNGMIGELLRHVSESVRLCACVCVRACMCVCMRLYSH